MKKLLFALIRYSGLPFCFREICQRGKVTIVLFHDISPENAEIMFGYLKKNYSIISLQYFLNTYYSGEWKLPKKPLVITFDDGHKGNYSLLTVIRKLNIPVTIFLCAGIINTKRHFWFTVKHQNYSFYDLKSMSNQNRLTALKDAGYTTEMEYEDAQALNKKEIVEMAQWVSFQSHTLFHPFLPRCTTEEAEKEISGSKSLLEEEFGMNIYAFSYPNGDYSERDIDLCAKSGYRCAITLDSGYNSADTDIFRLKRLSVNDTDDINELAVKASGFWGIFRKFLIIYHHFFPDAG